MEAYTNTNYAGSLVAGRSITGYCILLSGNLVTWKSKKQAVIARSNEMRNLGQWQHVICEILWLK